MVRFNLKNFLNWLSYSVDVRIYPSLRVLTFKLTIAFMALLIVISAMIVGIGISIVVRERITEIARIYETHFPSAELVDGMLIVDNDTPVVYRGRDYQVVMDVTGNEHQRESEFPIALFFLRDRMIIDTASTGSKEYKYTFFGRTDMAITSSAIRSTRSFAAIVAFVFWSALLFINWSIHTALMTIFGSFVVGIVAAFFRILLPRNEQLKIALTAAVPVTVVTAIEHLLMIREGTGFGLAPLPGSLFLFNISIFAAFVIFGARGYLMPFIPKDRK